VFAVLAVIRQAVDQFQFERTSDEILHCLTGFRQQWDKFADALDNVAKRVETAQRGMEELTGTRRRQLERQLDAIDDLAVRRGVDTVTVLGDGEGEAIRRSAGDVRELPGGRAAG
jgi:DNA recombination protein RmuC